MECDLTDDVSALSMDGASAIAGMGLAKRLRKDFAKIQLGIPEEDEQQAAEACGEKEHRKSKSKSSDREHRKNSSKTKGEELLEPFPKTFEEWQEKKEKKHRHKSKKYHKKSSKSSSRSSKSRELQQEQEKQQQQHQMGYVGGEKLPIVEISIETTNFDPPQSPSRRRSDQLENTSDMHSGNSYQQSLASTANSTHTQSETAATSSLQRSFASSGAKGMAIKRSLHEKNQQTSFPTTSDPGLRSSFRSTRSRDSHESRTHLTGLSHQSLVTIEDLQGLRAHIECVKMEEKQVIDIFRRLEKEVKSATAKADKAKSHQQAIHVELEAASLERDHLQQQLGILHDENNKLHSKLRHLEERDSEKGLDNVLDSMEAKIKELKVRGRKSKARRKTEG